jgi:hypothetical protein
MRRGSYGECFSYTGHNSRCLVVLHWANNFVRKANEWGKQQKIKGNGSRLDGTLAKRKPIGSAEMSVILDTRKYERYSFCCVPNESSDEALLMSKSVNKRARSREG